MASLCRDSSRSYPGRSALLRLADLSDRPERARASGRRAVQKSAEVVVPRVTFQ